MITEVQLKYQTVTQQQYLLFITTSHSTGSEVPQEIAARQQAHDEDPGARQEEHSAGHPAHGAPLGHPPPKVAIPLARGASHGGSQK